MAKIEIPVWEKFTLTLEEAASYYNIGIDRLRMMTNETNCPFVLFVGKKRLIKKNKFNDYLQEKEII